MRYRDGQYEDSGENRINIIATWRSFSEMLGCVGYPSTVFDIRISEDRVDN